MAESSLSSGRLFTEAEVAFMAKIELLWLRFGCFHGVFMVSDGVSGRKRERRGCT